MTRYLLDTHIVSHLIKGHPEVLRRVVSVQMSDQFISAITEGELAYGLAKRPDAKRLHLAVEELLKRVDVLPWDRKAAASYGQLRARMEQDGLTLPPLDLLIAGHALSEAMTLVSNDRAFAKVPGLAVEDWTG